MGFVAHHLPYCFPDLADFDLFPASIAAPIAAAPHAAAPLLTCFSNLRRRPAPHMLPHLTAVATSFPNLHRLSAAESSGLMSIPGGCPTLQELELHCCTDLTLRSVSAFVHLQILRIISAVGRCCAMLEELTIADHRMDH